MTAAAPEHDDVVFDGRPLDIEAIAGIADGRRRAVLSTETAFRGRIDAGARVVLQLLADDGVI
ncbi:hypothetical protein ABTP18_20215, partial [Acinetobacter baumannii]